MADYLLLLNAMADLENDEDNNLFIEDRFKEREDAFQLSDVKFMKLFRLNKELTLHLIEELSEVMPAATRTTALDVKTRVLAALRFFASGSYQTCVGNDRYLKISQASVSRAIHEVSAAIDAIKDRWMKFPTAARAQAAVTRGFFDKFNLPGVLGAIDCTHVAIVSPPEDDLDYAEYMYVNRKGVHTINTQLVCDSDLRILHVNALFPGSTTDKFIWRFCNLKRYLVEKYENNPNMNLWLIGDSGYNLEPWLMTIQDDVQEGSPEEDFNTTLKTARCCIERCNGVLKARFRCLLKDRVLHYHPEVATKIINACCVLHNMCMAYGLDGDSDEEEEDDPAMDEDDSMMDEDAADNNAPANPRNARRNPVLVAGERVRARLIQRHFV